MFLPFFFFFCPFHLFGVVFLSFYYYFFLNFCFGLFCFDGGGLALVFKTLLSLLGVQTSLFVVLLRPLSLGSSNPPPRPGQTADRTPADLRLGGGGGCQGAPGLPANEKVQVFLWGMVKGGGSSELGDRKGWRDLE